MLGAMVDEHLLDQAAAARGIEPSLDEYRNSLEGDLESFMVSQGMSKEEFEAVQLRPSGTGSFEEFVEEGCNDPSFQRVFVYNRRLVLKSASRLVDTLLLLFSGQYLYDHLY